MLKQTPTQCIQSSTSFYEIVITTGILFADKEDMKILRCVRNVHMLARDVFDVAKRQFQNMQKNFTWIKLVFLKPILDGFSHMTHQIEA